MAGGIQGVGVGQTNTPQQLENREAHAQSVSVQSHGQTVSTQPSASSQITDALEEAGQFVSDKKADKLSKREARSKSASRVRAILQKYLKQVTGAKQSEKFEKLAQSLKDLSNPTPDQIREKIREFKSQSEDENLESALLLALEEVYSTEGANEDLLAAVRGAKSQLGEELQDFYQNQVKSFEDINEVYQQLLGEHGEDDFVQAANALIKRLGTDLQAQGSSVEGAKVKSTVDSLYHLEVARNTYTAFAGLMEKMQTEFGTAS